MQQLGAGTDSMEGLGTKCPSPVSTRGIAVHKGRAGSTEVTRPWMRELSVAKFVFIGRVSAVYLRLTSQYAIVESSSCIDLHQCIFVTRVTVATD